MEIKNRFIESLFFGNIDPKAREVKEGGRTDKLRKLLPIITPNLKPHCKTTGKSFFPKSLTRRASWIRSRNWTALTNGGTSFLKRIIRQKT